MFAEPGDHLARGIVAPGIPLAITGVSGEQDGGNSKRACISSRRGIGETAKKVRGCSGRGELLIAQHGGQESLVRWQSQRDRIVESVGEAFARFIACGAV